MPIEIYKHNYPEPVASPVSLANGQSTDNANVFYIGMPDWLETPDYNLWNAGTEDNHLKTEYDPYPKGWRVPSDPELNELTRNYSPWTTDEKDQFGYWFSGLLPYSETVPQVFSPAAGYRTHYDGTTWSRGYWGQYWSSKPYMNTVLLAFTSDNNVGIWYTLYRAVG